uniref:DUF7804 domain-containing protein n=1 Tax=Physcomitrium patens TaxID=3218 RepID=A0A7I4F3X7_PHYPA|nr:uncharacterized protein LOC112290933 [Physcomitrium patens]|eukprot:XP_024393546.1 uncharacterized protein LOC112290933 [Physcomitrella patens]
MVHAVTWNPLSNSSAPCCCTGTSDVSLFKQNFLVSKGKPSLNKLVPMRRLPATNAAIRNSSEASTDFQGRDTTASCGMPCAINCPINRDTNIQLWVEEFIPEIVKNIQEAPFLQYVFDSKGRPGRSQRQKIPRDLGKNPDFWPPIREFLSRAAPDGVLLVQKMEPGCSPAFCLAREFQSGNHEEIVCPFSPSQGGADTSVWGVLVQARGVHANACYLLKTTQVPSSAGICTSATRRLHLSKSFLPNWRSHCWAQHSARCTIMYI